MNSNLPELLIWDIQMPGAFLCIYVQHNLEAVEYLKATAHLVSHTSVQPLSMKRPIFLSNYVL